MVQNSASDSTIQAKSSIGFMVFTIKDPFHNTIDYKTVEYDIYDFHK